MTLTTEDLGMRPDADAATIDEVLQSDGFGKFIILAASEEEYIQAGNDWNPGEACGAFLQSTNSDPWVLELREGNRQFRAVGHATLEQVRQAFLSYLGGEMAWRSAFTWAEVLV